MARQTARIHATDRNHASKQIITRNTYVTSPLSVNRLTPFKYLNVYFFNMPKHAYLIKLDSNVLLYTFMIHYTTLQRVASSYVNCVAIMRQGLRRSDVSSGARVCFNCMEPTSLCISTVIIRTRGQRSSDLHAAYIRNLPQQSPTVY